VTQNSNSFYLILLNLYALYLFALHLYAQIAYSSLVVKSFDGSYLNVALVARYRRHVGADWLGADMSIAIVRLA
jgi:hypothetical protein